MERRHRNPIPESIQRRITKLFVTNLPEGCSGADLAIQVRPYGQIFDLYIARKRDKGGNRFGFISMLDVKEKGELLKSLRNIRMGDYKLWFSVARFVLEDGEINVRYDAKQKHPVHEDKTKSSEGIRMEHRKSSFVAEDRSFKDSLVGKVVTLDNKTNAFSSLHGKSLVARMVDIQALENIKCYLKEVCPGRGKVQYLGGLDILVSFEDADTAEAVRLATQQAMDKFVSITTWEGQALGFERVAWLKLKGIPLHLLNNDTIDAVGGMFGKVVYSAKRFESDSDLSYEYIGILVGDGKRVNAEVVINWKGRKFQVWVEEELNEWIPDFIDSQEEDVTSDSEGEESVADQSPVVEPEKHVNDADVVNIHVDQPILETDQNGNDGIDDCYSLPINGMENNVEGYDFAFTPAVDFPFEKDLEVGGPLSVSKVIKRKKFKKLDLGRPSNGYVSSQESLKALKRSKNDDDLFGLDELLGLNKSDDNLDVEAQDNVSINGGEDHLDLNKQPATFAEDNNTIPDSFSALVFNNDDQLQAVEVAETIALGEKLGTDLTRCNDLIQDSITNEGLHRGKI
ncbi:hypothetical protein SSX86_022601 [Deinandra increscens subsp. villosa]|uniref:RRM domain-containing protein n=1 Tax=Deinandra increscens subsp. villosa TaxID=3103831 RepID=A0AAP0GP81_9ASTR